MIAAEIAAVLGSARREGRHWRCRCPVHGGCSLTLRDGRNALLVRCWGGCDARDVLTGLARLGLLGGVRDNGRSASVWPKGDHDDGAAPRTEAARRIWGEAREASGSPVERYLAGRGITLPAPASLRWAPALRRPDGTTAPAMIGRVDGPDGELIGVHRTWLDRSPDGRWQRRDRAMLGRAAGGAVRLAPAAETLLIAEGVETAIAGLQATQMPTWAALSTSGLVALVLPPSVRAVVILADNDANGAGESAARTAAQRWLADGRSVRIAMPPEPGIDFNDVLACRLRPELGVE